MLAGRRFAAAQDGRQIADRQRTRAERTDNLRPRGFTNDVAHGLQQLRRRAIQKRFTRITNPRGRMA